MGKAEVLQWMINHRPLIFVIVVVAAVVVIIGVAVETSDSGAGAGATPPGDTPDATPGGASSERNCDFRYKMTDTNDPSKLKTVAANEVKDEVKDSNLANSIPGRAGPISTICGTWPKDINGKRIELNDFVLNNLKCAPGWKTETDSTRTNDSIVDHLIIKAGEETTAISQPTCDDPLSSPCMIDVNLDKLEGCNKRYCEISDDNEFTITDDGSNELNISLLKYWGVGAGETQPTDACLFGPGCPSSLRTTTIGNMDSTTITCAHGKYGKCEGEGECSEHDNNQPACEAAPPAAECRWTTPTDVNLDPSVLTCGDSPSLTWSNNHYIHTKCTKDCYMADTTDPVRGIDPCSSLGDSECNANEHCEYINEQCMYKYIYKNDNIVGDLDLTGKFTADGVDHPEISCPPNNTGSTSYNIGDNVETGECLGGDECINRDEGNCVDNNCSWYAYDNAKQKICTGGGAEFNITNNCLPLTCESWDGCGTGKHLNPDQRILGAPAVPGGEEVTCCLDNLCADVSCDGGQAETSIFKKRDFSSNDPEYDPGYDTPADKDITCCDIKTCTEYIPEGCPEGQTRPDGSDNLTNVVDLKCLGTINIQGYSGDTASLRGILNSINDDEITLQNIEQDGSNYILKNTSENPLTIRKSQIDALITSGGALEGVETSIKTREEWARDGICDYYHRSTSSSNKCCQHQTCSDFAAAQNGLCNSASQYLINTNIPNNKDDIPHHTATEEACCSDIDNFERAVAQAEEVNQGNVDSGQNKIRCYRDKDTTIDILKEYINFNDSDTKKLPPYIDFDFTISDNQGSLSREVNINPIDGGPEPPLTGNYYDLREARCKVGGSSNITISCSEDKNITNNEEWVNRREEEGELAEIMTEYGIESGNKDELISMLDNEGRWKYHIHGCIDDDNLFCSFPTVNYPSDRYNIQIETADLSDHTRLYPLGLLKYNMDYNPPYGISCVNSILETQSEDLPAQSAASNYLHENNTLSEFYIIKDDIQHIHKERDISQKNVIPYCPEQRGEYMFAGCNLKFAMRGDDDLDTNYIKDGDEFYQAQPQGDYQDHHIPTLTRERPHPTSAAIYTCNDLINERKEDLGNDVLCHGPDNARFLKIYQYCDNPNGPCYQSLSKVTKSYSSILTNGNSPSIFNDVCKENYYPEGLDINDITRSSAFPTRRDICVPKNDEHGYEYNMENLNNSTLNNDFFTKEGGTTAKNFTEIFQNSPTGKNLLTAHCQPDGSTDPPPLSGSCHGSGTGSGTCDGQDKESCESEGCEWWPNYSCKKTDTSGLNSIQEPEDYSKIEIAILDNVNKQTLDTAGWPQHNSIGVHHHDDGSGGYHYVGIPIKSLNGEMENGNKVYCYHKERDGGRCDNVTATLTPEGNTYMCPSESGSPAKHDDCVPKVFVSLPETETSATYDLIQIGDTMEESTETTPQVADPVNGVLLNGIKIPIDELRRGETARWRSLLTSGPGAVEEADLLINFPNSNEPVQNLETLNIDIENASRYIVPDNQDNQLNPGIEPCSDYFSREPRPPPISGTKGFYPGGQFNENAPLYCKKQCDPANSDNCEIKGSFYYGTFLDNNDIIDITESNTFNAAISKNTDWCSPDNPYLIKVANNGDNSYYVCGNCDYIGTEDDDGRCNPQNQEICKCYNEKGQIKGGGDPPGTEEAASQENCKWILQNPNAPWDDENNKLILSGCKACSEEEEITYLTYADGTQTGEGTLQTNDFPSRYSGDYPDGDRTPVTGSATSDQQYKYPRNREYEYTGTRDVNGVTGGIFQPGDGGWNRVEETKASLSPDWSSAQQFLRAPDTINMRDWLTYYNRLNPAGDPGATGIQGNTYHTMIKSMNYGYDQVAGQWWLTDPAGGPYSPNPRPNNTAKALDLLNNNEQDPNNWYHETICRTKQHGQVGYLVTPPADSRNPQPERPANQIDLSSWTAEQFTDAKLDPRIYELAHNESRCSADTVWGRGEGVETGPTWVGAANSNLDNRGFIETTGGNDPCKGHDVPSTDLKCCNDSSCSMWDESIDSYRGYIPCPPGVPSSYCDGSPPGYVQAAREPILYDPNNASNDPSQQVKYDFPQPMYGGGNRKIFPYRGRCLKKDGELCEEDTECWGKTCCNGYCANIDFTDCMEAHATPIIAGAAAAGGGFGYQLMALRCSLGFC